MAQQDDLLDTLLSKDKQINTNLFGTHTHTKICAKINNLNYSPKAKLWLLLFLC